MKSGSGEQEGLGGREGRKEASAESSPVLVAGLLPRGREAAYSQPPWLGHTLLSPPIVRFTLLSHQ